MWFNPTLLQTVGLKKKKKKKKNMTQGPTYEN